MVGEAVWWVTIVDATLVRHHPDTYDETLASQGRAERLLIEETLAGLRFVRNQMGHGADIADFIHAAASSPADDPGRITSRTWKPVQEPMPASLLPRARTWEVARYQAYQAQLAGRTIGETFGRAAAFLQLAAERAVSPGWQHPADAAR